MHQLQKNRCVETWNSRVKTKRSVVNDFYLRWVRENLLCVADCGAPYPDPHHVTTRGAGGGDVPKNIMPLCRKHHNIWGDKGPGYMVENFKGVKLWLERAGRDDVFRRIEKIERYLNARPQKT